MTQFARHVRKKINSVRKALEELLYGEEKGRLEVGSIPDGPLAMNSLLRGHWKKGRG